MVHSIDNNRPESLSSTIVLMKPGLFLLSLLWLGNYHLLLYCLLNSCVSTLIMLTGSLSDLQCMFLCGLWTFVRLSCGTQIKVGVCSG